MCDEAVCFFKVWMRVKGEERPNPFLCLIIVLAQGELSVNHGIWIHWLRAAWLKVELNAAQLQTMCFVHS